MDRLNIIIAIDGHSSTGKSTFAKMIAKKYSLIYIDTGALYRGVALYSVNKSIIDDHNNIDLEKLKQNIDQIKMEFFPTAKNPRGELYLNGVSVENEIRSMRISSVVSIIASIPTVRAFIDKILKRYGVQRGVIMDGRDIGTVLFPDAEIKIFMTADAEVRAKRRYDELIKKGDTPDFQEVLENVRERDRLDEQREIAPLRKASDAIVLDNSNMTIDEQMDWMDCIISNYIAKSHKKPSVSVNIDNNSGFCYGVVRAIDQVERYLSNNKQLYSLGSIVHNNLEIERLRQKGLVTINYDQLKGMRQGTIFIRAHGEPPSSYNIANQNNLKIIDCTCPVVLKLQEKIKNNHKKLKEIDGQLVIFGKLGHAEVNGLIGQIGGDAIIVEKFEDIEKINFNKAIHIFSQTTKDPDEYKKICNAIKKQIISVSGPIDDFKEFNTICGQVSSRHLHIKQFAKGHSLIIFVSGRESSNGKILYELCKSENSRSYMIESKYEINRQWFNNGDTIGVCGATSTPKWLLEETAKYIADLFV